MGIITKTSRSDLFILEGNSTRYLIKEKLPNINGLVIVYGTLNCRINEDKTVVQFLNPRLILDIRGQELWRAKPKDASGVSPEVASEPSPPEPEGEEDFF
ncbi:MAG: hypothetical protein QW228_07780 [Candidatus Aenigmatarchaeota archaeon]